MINNPQIPAGIFHDTEIFVRDNRVYALHDGKAINYTELPFAIRKAFTELYLSDSSIKTGLDLMGITNEDDRIYQTIVCNSGGFDKKADFERGHINREFWNCGKWVDCPGFGKVCKVPGKLSRKELLLAVDIYSGLPDKQTAPKNGIEHNTLRTHIRRINDKINAHCRADLVQWVKDNILL